MGKEMAVEVDNDDGEGKIGSDGKVKQKKIKNLRKQMDYHSRKRRDFRQREPILNAMESAGVVEKRQKTTSD